MQELRRHPQTPWFCLRTFVEWCQPCTRSVEAGVMGLRSPPLPYLIHAVSFYLTFQRIKSHGLLQVLNFSYKLCSYLKCVALLWRLRNIPGKVHMNTYLDLEYSNSALGYNSKNTTACFPVPSVLVLSHGEEPLRAPHQRKPLHCPHQRQSCACALLMTEKEPNYGLLLTGTWLCKKTYYICDIIEKRPCLFNWLRRDIVCMHRNRVQFLIRGMNYWFTLNWTHWF